MQKITNLFVTAAFDQPVVKINTYVSPAMMERQPRDKKGKDCIENRGNPQTIKHHAKLDHSLLYEGGKGCNE